MNSDEMSLGSSGTSMTDSKQNILFIMADQLVPFLTEPYGHPVVQMPNLDRLAEEGVTFDAARSPCPVCAPARASMLTGCYASNIGAYDNAAAFSSEQPTLPHYLTLAGYDTVIVTRIVNNKEKYDENPDRSRYRRHCRDRKLPGI